MGLALFDSNIVIDALNGYTQAIEEISYFSDIAISAVAWVEVMARRLRVLHVAPLIGSLLNWRRHFLPTLQSFTPTMRSWSKLPGSARIVWSILPKSVFLT